MCVCVCFFFLFRKLGTGRKCKIYRTVDIVETFLQENIERKDRPDIKDLFSTERPKSAACLLIAVTRAKGVAKKEE